MSERGLTQIAGNPEPPLNGPYEWFPSRRIAQILAYRRRFWPKEPFPFVSHRSLAEVFSSEPEDAA